MKIYKQEQVERRKEREREKGSSSERRMYCVLVSAGEQKKNTITCKKKITYFFTSIGWPLPFLGRLSTNRVGRRRKKRKRVTMKCGEREWWREKKINQPNNRQNIVVLLFIFCCCHIDSRNEENERERKESRNSARCTHTTQSSKVRYKFLFLSRDRDNLYVCFVPSSILSLMHCHAWVRKTNLMYTHTHTHLLVLTLPLQ